MFPAYQKCKAQQIKSGCQMLPGLRIAHTAAREEGKIKDLLKII